MAAPRKLEFGSLGLEATWASQAGIGAFQGMAADAWDVSPSNNVMVRDKYTGTVFPVNVDQAGQVLGGSSQYEVHPDNATLLCKTIPGFPRSTVEGKPNWLPSFTYKFYDAAQNRYRRQVGLMCDSWKLSCGGLDGELMVNIDWIGKNEEAESLFARPTLPDQRSFQMKDLISLTVGGVAEPNVEQFEINVAMNLRRAERPEAGTGRISWLDAGVGDVTGSFTLRSHTDFAQDYDGLIQGQNTGLPLVWTFNYPGSGSPADSIVITVALAVLGTSTRTGGVRDAQTRVTNFTGKGTATAEAITVAVSP